MSIGSTDYNVAFVGLDLTHEQRKAIVEKPEIVAIKIGYDQVIGRINDDIRRDGAASSDTLRMLASTNRFTQEQISRLETAVKAAVALVNETATRIQAVIGG